MILWHPVTFSLHCHYYHWFHPVPRAHLLHWCRTDLRLRPRRSLPLTLRYCLGSPLHQSSSTIQIPWLQLRPRGHDFTSACQLVCSTFTLSSFSSTVDRHCLGLTRLPRPSSSILVIGSAVDIRAFSCTSGLHPFSSTRFLLFFQSHLAMPGPIFASASLALSPLISGLQLQAFAVSPLLLALFPSVGPRLRSRDPSRLCFGFGLHQHCHGVPIDWLTPFSCPTPAPHPSLKSSPSVPPCTIVLFWCKDMRCGRGEYCYGLVSLCFCSCVLV